MVRLGISSPLPNRARHQNDYKQNKEMKKILQSWQHKNKRGEIKEKSGWRDSDSHS